MARWRQPAGAVQRLGRTGAARRRAAIARALGDGPEILLPGEPFGALGALTCDALNLERQRIRMQTGCTAALVTHAISEAIFWPFASRCSRRGRPASRR